MNENAKVEKYPLVKVFGKPALWTDLRVHQKNVPERLYVSHVRSDEETGAWFGTLEPRVLFNHFGSIVTKEPFDFGPGGYLEFTAETEPFFTKRSLTLAEFLEGDFDIEKEVEEMKKLIEESEKEERQREEEEEKEDNDNECGEEDDDYDDEEDEYNEEEGDFFAEENDD